MKILVTNANSVDPVQLPHSAASDLGLHFLPVTLFLEVSRLKWANDKKLTNCVWFSDSESSWCGSSRKYHHI